MLLCSSHFRIFLFLHGDPRLFLSQPFKTLLSSGSARSPVSVLVNEVYGEFFAAPKWRAGELGEKQNCSVDCLW